MANPMIELDDRLSVRVGDITRLMLSGANVIVTLNGCSDYFVCTKDEAAARKVKSGIIEALNRCQPREIASTTVADMKCAARACTEKAPLAYGQAQVNRIVDLLRQEFGDGLKHTGFMDDLWVALQVVYGPGGAVDFITDRLNYRR